MQIKPYDEIKVTDVVNVTGLSIYNYGNLAGKLQKGFMVGLKRDPANKYDVNATGVYFEGQQVGWIPKSSNSDFAKQIPKGATVSAMIIEHDRNASDISKKLFIQILPNELKRIGKDNLNIYANSINSRVPSSEISYSNTSDGWTQYTDKLIQERGAQTPKEKLNELLKPKENKMNKLVNDTIARNSNNATSAAFLEAGRIANNQATKLAAKHLPMMVRGYADTAVGRLIMANIAATAATQFRPGDKRLARLADAMMVTAYQEVIQSFDVEQMIEDMLSNETVKKALTKANEVPASE